MSVKKALLNPAVISVAAGILLFLVPFHLPNVAMDAIRHIGNLNTPCGMIILGSYLAAANFSNITEPLIWKTAAVRLILIPVLTFFLLSLIPDQFMQMRLTILIASATPTAAFLAIFASMLNKDSAYASLIVSVSTLLSLATIPVLFSLAFRLWNIA